jgi:hypothetical protein
MLGGRVGSKNCGCGDRRSGAMAPLVRKEPPPTVYGVWGGRGDSRGGTKANGAATSSSAFRSSQSCAMARIARSGRAARILVARINSPRIWVEVMSEYVSCLGIGSLPCKGHLWLHTGRRCNQVRKDPVAEGVTRPAKHHFDHVQKDIPRCTGDCGP